ncbi:tyrosine-type recombinase/integrase [Reyranella soli]|uniref:Phage integrase n=1 Tax=Reyranella soli TaxID=1230389 RepID=A0A512N8N6_9HYPH|nr:site-specific integrase [Reyranella soli]GEP55360.1 phage integrase [Reyranella soli]
MTVGFQLNARKVAAIKATGKKQVFTDGNGLRLIVEPAGSKRWLLRRMVEGKDREFGLGGYPAVSLDVARARAAALRAGSALPVTPKSSGSPIPPGVTGSGATFEEAAREFFEMHKASWKARAGATNWMSRMTMHAFPKIGGVDMREFSSADVLAVLKPIWTTLPGIAKKLRADIGAVVSLAVANRWCGAEASNAVAIAARALPRQPKSEGHEAMPMEAVPGFLRELHDIQADPLLKLAMAFVILTAKRSGEVRIAERAEIREEDAMWIIPASRMKAGRAHREPLTPQAMAILRQAQVLSGDSPYIFPNLNIDKPYSDMALLSLLRRNGHTATVHGFRATFRTWAAEETNYPRAICELALAHGNPDKIEAAYQRSDLEVKRRALMSDWASAAVGDHGQPLLGQSHVIASVGGAVTSATSDLASVNE